MYIYKKFIYLVWFYFSLVQIFAQTLLQKNCITQLAYPPPPPLSPGFDCLKKNHFKKCKQLGMGLVEMLIVMTMLALISVGTAYYFTQSQTVMRSSAQDSDCQSIAQSALDRVVSLGTRLYGYRVGHTDSDLRYNPLFIKKGTQITGSTPAAYRITDTSSGNNLSLTDKYKNLYEELTNNTPPALLVNTGVPLVNLSGSGFINIGTSVLLVNSVNFLQYMYNSDPEFFNGNSGKGKDFTITSSTSTSNNKVIASLWKDYLKKYNLQNVKFYIRINPVDLKNQKVIESYSGIKCYYTRYKGSKFVSTEIPCPRPSSHPSHKLVLTHPRLSVGTSTLSSSSNLRTIGNPDLGFQVTVKLSYEKNNQDYFCKSMQRFAHQTRLLMEQTTPINVSVTSLKNGHNKNLLPNGGRKQTSCDTDGSNYRNITMELNFDNTAGRTTKEFGTLFLCRGVRWRYPDRDCNTNKIEKIYGPWRRCHQVKFPDQRGNTESVLLNSSGHNIKLRLKFNNLKEDRSYALEIAEVSQLGISKPPYQRITNSRFYIDATRPTLIASINDSDVGSPDDFVTAPIDANWIDHLPKVRFKHGKNHKKGPGLQCNDSDVNFHGCIIDKFTHNLGNCTATGRRRDGNGTQSIPASSISISTNSLSCSGTLRNPVQHGRQTIKITPSDICGSGSSDQLEWDTDLPSTFVARPFSTNPYWLQNDKRTKYAISTLVPASRAGTFPKHYAVTCYGKEYSNAMRTASNGGSISCEFNGSRNSGTGDHDGCNPANFGVKYHHICGDSSSTQATQWGVWVAHPNDGGGSCENVPCEPRSTRYSKDLICCDGFRDECGNARRTHRCAKDNHPRRNDCGNPTGGGNSEQDTTSDCPPLGLYDCNYTLPCEGDAGDLKNRRDNGDACKDGPRQGDRCTFNRTGQCKNRFTDQGYGGYSQGEIEGTRGECHLNGNSKVQCTVDALCKKKYKYEKRSDSCEYSGNLPDDPPIKKDCNLPPNINREYDIDGEWSSGELDGDGKGVCADSNPHEPCDLKVEKVTNTNDCRAKDTDCPLTFIGTCQEPQGDCDPKGPGGDGSGAQCTVRPPTTGPPPTTITRRSPDQSFGACARGTCTPPFCAENCASVGRCHVKDVNGTCRPSCGHAARLIFNKSGFGPDRKPNTSDDLHVYRRSATSCSGVSVTYSDGVTVNNWVQKAFHQGVTPYEVVQGGGVCCMRGSTPPSTPPTPVSTPSACEFGDFATCKAGIPVGARAGTTCRPLSDGCYDRICKDGYKEDANGNCIRDPIPPTCSGNQYATKELCENVRANDFCVQNSNSCWVQGPPIPGQCDYNYGTCGACFIGEEKREDYPACRESGESTFSCFWQCDGENGGSATSCEISQLTSCD